MCRPAVHSGDSEGIPIENERKFLLAGENDQCTLLISEASLNTLFLVSSVLLVVFFALKKRSSKADSKLLKVAGSQIAGDEGEKTK